MATIKSKKRDKVKHSAGGRQAKKGGKGGHGWGHVDDDMKYINDSYAVDDHDPNYESPEDEEEAVINQVAKANKAAQKEFSASMQRLKIFKESLRGAAREYHNSHDSHEFVRCIIEQNCPQHHGQIVYILISYSFDQTDQKREAICGLVNHLISTDSVSKREVDTSFNFLANRMPDTVLDVPSAPVYVIEYIDKLQEAGTLSEKEAKQYKVLVHDETPDNQATVLDVKRHIKTMFDEYFASESVDELIQSIQEMESTKYHPEVVKKGISLSLDRDGRARELVSAFLAEAAGEEGQDYTTIARVSVEEGFRILLGRIDDLHNDVPDIMMLLSYFLARAISDEAIVPSFLNRCDENDALSAQVIARVKAVLKEKHHGARLSTVWGPGDGRRVRELKETIKVFVSAYLSTADQTEAVKRVRELEAPYYHHEIVKTLFSTAIDRDDKAMALVDGLLVTLLEDGITSKSQIKLGLQRIEKRLPDMELDAPSAPTVYENLRAKLNL